MVVERLRHEFTRKIWLLALIIVFLYAFFSKREMIEIVHVQQTKVNMWDGFYALTNDMYLLTYFVFPIILFLSVGILIRESRHEVFIRFATPRGWAYRTLKLFLVETAPLFTVLFVLSLFMTIGLPYEGGWSGYTQGIDDVNATSVLQEQFSIPWHPLPVQLLLLLLFLITVHFSLAGLFFFHQKKGWLYAQTIVTFFFGVFGFKALPEELKFLSPTTYLSVAMTSLSYSSLLVAALVLVFVIAGQHLVFGQLTTLQRMDWGKWKDYGPYMLYGGLVFLHISYTAMMSSNEITTGSELVTATFIGVNSDYFSYLSLMSYLILFFGATYMSQIRMQRELQEISHYKLIRYKSPHRWFHTIIVREVMFFAVLITCLIGATLLVGQLMRLEFSFGGVFEHSLPAVVAFLFVSTVFQLLVYTLICFIVTWLLQEAYAVPMVLGVLSILLFPSLNVGWLPVGMNALVVLESHSIPYVLSILAGTVVLLMTSAHLLFRRSLQV
ncbi:hypothetical protein [Exiguobacterium sp. SH0S2]|uniref:hypothetical protein n=1 Tax=Exiguobacterium sp. SH0S2 TaxID=2510950 RepID=UPI00103BABA6|nr:hypothetical protein [Exiguobacterium sp. SH0S2]TCI62848.1 hypothetical protein EVJ21_04845 [Exiguobacterium sp. SH0S2]